LVDYFLARDRPLDRAGTGTFVLRIFGISFFVRASFFAPPSGYPCFTEIRDSDILEG